MIDVQLQCNQLFVKTMQGKNRKTKQTMQFFFSLLETSVLILTEQKCPKCTVLTCKSLHFSSNCKFRKQYFRKTLNNVFFPFAHHYKMNMVMQTLIKS